MLRRTTALVIGIALGAAALSARAQVLEIATDQSPVGLDPHIATAFSTTMVLARSTKG
jgi:peptide/nickel transport system substrate-binding protein